MSKEGSKKNPEMMRWVWIAVALIVYLVIAYVPTPTGVAVDGVAPDGALTEAGLKAIGLMIAAVITWITGCIPTTMSVFLFMFAAAFPGVGLYPSAAAATKAGMNPTVIFVIVSFILALGLTDSGLGNRVALKMSVLSKGSPSKVVMYIMFACAFISMFISDVPAVATFVPISMALVERNNCAQGKSNFGKALFIGISFAALIGGMGTPAGSSMNILALNQLKDQFDVSITFMQWSAMGIPLVIISMIVVAFLVAKIVFKPEFKELQGMQTIADDYKALGGFSKNEKLVLIVFVLMIACWLCGGSSVPVLGSMEVSTIAILGGLVFFLPKIGFLDWNGCKNRIGWDVVMLMLGANVLGGALQSSGAAAWIANSLLGGLASASTLVVVTVIVIFTIVVHVICPVNPALVGILVPCLGSLALTMGQNPGFLCIPMAFSVSICFLTIYDPVPLIAYDKGYFSQGDYAKAGIISAIGFAIVCVAVVMALAGPLGLM